MTSEVSRLMIQQECLHILPRRVERIFEAAELMSVGRGGVGESEDEDTGWVREQKERTTELDIKRTAFSNFIPYPIGGIDRFLRVHFPEFSQQLWCSPWFYFRVDWSVSKII